MFELFIILCRFLFIIYIVYFLWQGIVYILDERGIRPASRTLAISKQRVCIVFFHLTAFLIIAYIPGEFSFDFKILKLGAVGLGLLLAGNFAVEKIYKNSCHIMWNGVFFLLDIGIVTLQRLSPYLEVNNLPQKQLTWFFVGFVAMLVIPFVLKIISKSEKLEKVYLLFSFVFLILPLIIGISTHGALNWIVIKGFSFQPSELVKFLYVFYLASVFRRKKKLGQLIFPAIASGLLVIILVLERDLGGALIFFMTFMVMLYISTGSLLLFGGGMAFASVAALLSYKLFRHIQVRVSSWLNPWADINDGGHQIAQSLFAISTWGLLGRGLTRGIPYKIPVVESDFIFAAICEEMGGIFAICMIGIYIMIFYRGVHISLRCKKMYYSLLAAGFTSMLAFQTFLIIGGVSKFIPLTGVTLPFVSYGGSSIVVSILIIGILEWIYMYNEDSE